MFYFFFLLISFVDQASSALAISNSFFFIDTALFVSFSYFISLSSVYGLATPGRGVKGGERQRERGCGLLPLEVRVCVCVCVCVSV